MTLQIPIGSVVMVIHVFDSAQTELEHLLEPPFPRWARDLYDMAALQDRQMKKGSNDITLSAALAALRGHLNHRIELLAWVCGQLQELGWDLTVYRQSIIAHTISTPEFAKEQLDQRGVAGPLLKVTEAGEDGFPKLYEPRELHLR